MQGNLSEIDIRSILQLIELGQRTGELFVEAYGVSSGGVAGDNHRAVSDHRAVKGAVDLSWFVFFVNGQVIYASDSGNSLLRLRDHLRRYRLDHALDRVNISPSIATVNALEYGHLWALIENHSLTPSQGRSIVQHMVNETLFDLFSLHQGTFTFEIGSALAPQLTTFEIGPLVAKSTKQVQEWKQFHPYIQSPSQILAIADPEILRESLTESTFRILGRWVDGKTSIRQMARFLHHDIPTVAKAIYPYVQQGIVHLIYPPLDGSILRRDLKVPSIEKVPRVVCIDDGATIRKTVEYILSQHGYEVSSISNPLKALSLVFQLKPDLILCDIAMPELDGYELCAMLRQAAAFRQIPIVMLTGKDGFIDRVKARMVGATDYLTKPFGEGELLTLVEKYVGIGRPDRPHPDKLLEKALEDELEIDITSASA
jgi:twitching motility two-component system response regulator PilG